MVNTKRVHEIIDTFRFRVEKDKEILSKYVIIFGDVCGYYGGETDLEAEALSLYQYLDREIFNFVAENDYTDISRFDTFLSKLFSDNVSIYKCNKYKLEKLFPTPDDGSVSMLAKPLGFKIGDDHETMIAINFVIVDDKHLRSLFDSICRTYNLIYSEYKAQRMGRKTLYNIRNNVDIAINEVTSSLTNDMDNINDLIEFYDYVYKAIENYSKNKEEK